MPLNEQIPDIDISEKEFFNPKTEKNIIQTGDVEISLDSQKYWHRKTLFRCCLAVCVCLYVLFLAAIAKAIFSEDFFRTLLEYKHMTAFILALLIVPTALLWGMVRAAYMPEKNVLGSEDLTNIVRETHPLVGT